MRSWQLQISDASPTQTERGNASRSALRRVRLPAVDVDFGLGRLVAANSVNASPGAGKHARTADDVSKAPQVSSRLILGRRRMTAGRARSNLLSRQ